MKMTFAIIGTIIAGVVAGMLLPEINSPLLDNASMYILYILLIFVGIDIGAANKKTGMKRILALLKNTLLVVFGTVAGTLIGGLFASLIISTPLNEGLAVASGFAWYSLSSLLLNQLSGPELGAVAFMTNVFREALVFICVPFLCSRRFHFGSISIAGASSMDVSLTVISKYVDADTSAVSFLHGVMLSALVPVLVPLLYAV